MKTEKQSRKMTRREFLVGAGVLGAGVIVTSCAPKATPSPTVVPAATAPAGPVGIDLSGSGSVVVYDGGGSWGAAKRMAYFDPFEAKTGIAVVANPAIGDGPILAGIEAGAPGYDVINCSAARFSDWADKGLLEPIDYNWWDPADKAAIGPAPAHEFGVPALYYAMIMTWDPEQLGNNPPKNWADFWNTKEFPGSRTLGHANDPSTGTLEIALMADGVDPADLYPLDLDRAYKSLDRIAPDIPKFWARGAEPVQLLADGEVTIASAWNGRVSSFLDGGGNLGYTWNQGILLYDYWAVPKGAKNVENAMKFIAFVSQARPQARFAEQIAYSPTNTRAFDFIGSERAKVLPTAPQWRDTLVVMDYGWYLSEGESGKQNLQIVLERWEEWLTRAK